MERDFENVHNIGDMDDGELRDLILQELDEYHDIDLDVLEIRVNQGHVTLAGRVGSEAEVQEVEHVVVDMLGVERVTNEMLVLDSRRAEMPEAADDAAVFASGETPMLGESFDASVGTSAHRDDDIEGDLYGTQDVADAVSNGRAYEPPDEPIQIGTRSLEDH